MALSLEELLGGIQPASWRGIEFHMADVRVGAGRRVQTFLFPGIDTPVHQDLGALVGRVRLPGLIVGDDYVQRAQLLQQAFLEPGPGTLVHPWYGELTVVLVDSPEIEFSWRRLRVASFWANFEFWREVEAPAFDTLGQILLAVAAVKSAARNMLRELLAPLRLAFGVVNAIGGFGIWLQGSFTNLVGGLTNGGALLGLLAPNLAALGALGGTTADDAYADAVADCLDGTPAAMADTALPAATPAIAAGGDSSAETDLVMDPAAIAGTLLTAAAWPAPASIAVPAGVVMAARSMALVGAISAGARIDFVSRQDALAWKATAMSAIATAQQAAAAMGADAPAQVATLYQALSDLRLAVARDISVEIGRLPSVKHLTVPGDCTLWQVANHLASADATLIVPIFDDLVARNRIRRPGVIPAGTVLEYLG